jgi:arylsulfatase A-like enzyme
MKTVDDLKLADNTVIIFTSDNGGLSAPEWKLVPVTSNAPLREGKGHVYEGGIRVPYIVKWPGAKPRADDTPVCGVDFLPTFCDAAGVKKPPAVDGTSLVPLITRGEPLGQRDLYWHYPHYSNQQGKPGGAVRQGDFKLVELYEDNTLELYNLKDDISERHDLSKSMPDKTRQLHSKLTAWRKSIPGIQMPTPNPEYDPAKAGYGYWWQTGTLPK